jgi:hypothetical protein
VWFSVIFLVSKNVKQLQLLEAWASIPQRWYQPASSTSSSQAAWCSAGSSVPGSEFIWCHPEKKNHVDINHTRQGIGQRHHGAPA